MITKSLRFLLALLSAAALVFLVDFYLSRFVFQGESFPNIVSQRMSFSEEGVLRVVYPDGEREFTKKELKVKYDNSDYKKVVRAVREEPSKIILRLGLYLGFFRVEVPPRIVYDKSPLVEFLKEIKPKYNVEPKDARFVFKDGKVKEISVEKEGRRINEEKFWKEVEEKISRWYENKVVQVDIKFKKVEPKIKLSQINQFGIEGLIGVGSSSYKGSSWEREYNIILATKRISGNLVPKGGVFSFNKALGEVSAATGYKESYVIRGGRTVLDAGGGVCQVSTTLFRAILNAGLPIVERRAHSYRVSYYEQDSKPGFDATVYSPYVDLKFRNDTPASVLVLGEVDTKNKKVYFYLYGKKDNRKVFLSKVRIFDVVPAPEPLYIEDSTLPPGVVKQIDFAAPGAKVYFDYKVLKDGKTIFQKTFKSIYRPWQAVYLVGKS